MHQVKVNGTSIDVFPVEAISLKALLQNDSAESRKLYKAAASPGFFHLDLRDSEDYLSNAEKMYAVTKKYFTQPKEVKLKDFIKEDEFRGVKFGTYDSFEIPRDDLINDPNLPEILQGDKEILQQFTSDCNEILGTLLTRVSESLWPDNSSTRAALEDMHRYNNGTTTSNTSVKIYSAHTAEKLSDIPDTRHTDGGTFTLLHTDQWGTQIKLTDSGASEDQWAWVESKPGHVIINVGDSLQALSGGRLRSCLHKFTQPVDGFNERWLVMFFLRPAHGASLAAL